MKEVFEGKDGQFYFHVKAGNGQIVAQSEGYVSRSNAERGYEALLEAVREDIAPTEELDGDAAIAIGEHAFAAGYAAAHDVHPNDLEAAETLALDIAWSAYTPPEEVCGLAEAVAGVIVAEAAAGMDKRRGRK